MTSRYLAGVGIALVLVFVFPASSRADSSQSDRDCRYHPPERQTGSFTHRVFPRTDVFRPLIADMKAPRFSANWRNLRFDSGVPTTQTTGGDFNAGVVSFGETFGGYAWRDGHCNGIQVGFFGAVFSQFNLDTASADLINSDFQAGIPVTWRLGHWSGRLRTYHQSSHLGDEFILKNQKVDEESRKNLSFEAADTLVSHERDWWRVYGGVGVIFRSFTNLVEPLYFQGGAELRANVWEFGTSTTRVLPLLAADVKSFQARDWGVTVSAKGGIEIAKDLPVVRRFRFMASFLKGFVPFGQFFNSAGLTNYGLEGQIEF